MSDSRVFGLIKHEDPRDNDFLIRDVLPQSDLPQIDKKFWWADGWHGDQGSSHECVTYSWNHWLEDGPVIQDVIPGRRKPLLDTTDFYNKCQLWDDVPGEGYNGTTLRAGAKILQRLEVIDEYRWAKTLDEVIAVVTHHGPIIAGTRWTKNMSNPTSHRHMIRPTGRGHGGHAYLINGVDTVNEIFRIKNSWGRHWGDNGHAYIRFHHFERLLDDDGDACTAFENKVSRIPVLESLRDPS